MARAGAKIAVLLTDSHASRNAYKMARALTSPERDVMHLVTCVPSDEFRWVGAAHCTHSVSPQGAACAVRCAQV